jgi:uncharacterized protein (DUF2147 family)
MSVSQQASSDEPPRPNPIPLETDGMRILKRTAVFALALTAALMSSTASADNASPIGLWKNVDDVGGKPRALIRISKVRESGDGRTLNVRSYIGVTLLGRSQIWERQ